MFSEEVLVTVCLRKPRLKTLWCPPGPASGLWNFPSALASHALGFLWALAWPETCSWSRAVWPDRLLLCRPLWEPWIPKFPCSPPATLSSPASSESVSYLYFPALHNLKRSFFRGGAIDILQNQNLLGEVYKMSTPIIRYFPLKFIFSFKDKVLLTALKPLMMGKSSGFRYAGMKYHKSRALCFLLIYPKRFTFNRHSGRSFPREERTHYLRAINID